MEVNEWSQLSCSYFSSVCLSTLSNHLLVDGFDVSHVSDTGNVLFIRENYGLLFEQISEFSPKYYLNVLIKSMPKDLNQMSSLSQYIPLWFLIQDEILRNDLVLLAFTSQDELIHLLLKVYNEAILVYAKPVWNNPNLFAEKYEAFQRFNQTL